MFENTETIMRMFEGIDVKQVTIGPYNACVLLEKYGVYMIALNYNTHYYSQEVKDTWNVRILSDDESFAETMYNDIVRDESPYAFAQAIMSGVKDYPDYKPASFWVRKIKTLPNDERFAEVLLD